MKICCLLSLFIVLFFAVSLQGAEVNVSAAASLKDALNDIIQLYKKANSGDTIVPNYGSSGALLKQIENGAPADVFISADQQRMDTLEKKKLLVADTRKDLLGNSIVLITAKSSKSGVKSFQDLATDKIGSQQLAIGEPKSVPVGTYAMEIFEFLKIKDAVKPKLVFAADVRAVLAYVARNETEVGIVYRTDALIMPEKITVIAEAPAKSHTPIIYPAAITVTGTNPKGGKAFLDFLFSKPAEDVFKKYGFETNIRMGISKNTKHE
jgi:molybdate transport system substrate-binding protein